MRKHNTCIRMVGSTALALLDVFEKYNNMRDYIITKVANSELTNKGLLGRNRKAGQLFRFATVFA